MFRASPSPLTIQNAGPTAEIVFEKDTIANSMAALRDIPNTVTAISKLRLKRAGRVARLIRLISGNAAARHFLLGPEPHDSNKGMRPPRK
jgi:hypothetical protein